MPTYLEQLQQYADEQNRLKAEAKTTTERKQKKQTKPLTDQISELMRTVPPQLRNRPWSMAELVARLDGKYRDRPHAQHVGEALVRLGWKRVRIYHDGAEGHRVWLPQRTAL